MYSVKLWREGGTEGEEKVGKGGEMGEKGKGETEGKAGSCGVHIKREGV